MTRMRKVSKFYILPFFATCLLVLTLAIAAEPAGAQIQDCRQPEPVCAARDAVFAIAAFDPVGSAVRIGEDRLVTTRHSVADQETVDLFLADGTRTIAQVIPADYKGDLIFLSASDLPPGPVLEPADAEVGMQLYTVGADVSFQRIRAYDPGGVMLLPAENKPLAHLHHSAHSQKGNSGGALVDEQGRLIGIIAGGGEGYNDAVPSQALIDLAARSGPNHAEASAEIGAAVRVCTLLLEELQGRRGPLDEQQIKAITTSCLRSGNRQLYDWAGKTFGIRRLHEESLALFLDSFEQDPHSLNGRIGLAIAYHVMARYEDELPHLQFLFQHIPDDAQVLRFAIQAGVWGEDPDFAQAAFEKLKEVNPRAAPAAERFMTAPPPRPQPR